MKPSQQRYVPPSRRGREGDAEAHSELRGLEGASTQAPSTVRLVVLHGEHDTAGCPLDIEPMEGAAPPALLIHSPELAPADLLTWFAKTFDGGAGRLEFPATLSKQERARWHHVADRLRLHTQSVGVGEGRYLTVSTAAPSGAGAGHDDGPAASGPGVQLTREQQQQARHIWDICQMEGGKYWERSQGEIEAMVASATVPADLQQLVEKRLRGERVAGLLKSGRPSEALELLVEQPELAWVKDGESGGYPIHLAAWHGAESVVLFLASLPGCTEQRDGRRVTALAVAQHRGFTAIAELLLEAGARPERASFHEAQASSSDGSQEVYMSWTSGEERRRYQRGGAGGAPPGRGRGRPSSGPPPGLGRQQGRGRGPDGAAGLPAEQQQQQQQQQRRCPW